LFSGGFLLPEREKIVASGPRAPVETVRFFRTTSVVPVGSTAVATPCRESCGCSDIACR